MSESAIERLIDEHGHPLSCACLGITAAGRYGVSDERLCNCKVAAARVEHAAMLARIAELEAACAYRTRFDEIGEALREEMLEGPWRNPVTLESLKLKASRDSEAAE